MCQITLSCCKLCSPALRRRAFFTERKKKRNLRRGCGARILSHLYCIQTTPARCTALQRWACRCRFSKFHCGSFLITIHHPTLFQQAAWRCVTVRVQNGIQRSHQPFYSLLSSRSGHLHDQTVRTSRFLPHQQAYSPSLLLISHSTFLSRNQASAILYRFPVALNLKMDILQAEAEEIFRRQEFTTSRMVLNLIKVDVFPGKAPQYSETALAPNTFSPLTLDIHPPSGNATSNATLRLLHLHRLENGPFCVFPDHLVDIVRAFQIDPYVLYLVSSDEGRGFHQVNSATSDQRTLTFFLDNVAYMLFWSFDKFTLTTNGVIISRTSTNGQRAVSQFWKWFRRYETMIGHPFFLAYVPSIGNFIFVGGVVRRREHAIRSVESRTGFSLYSRDAQKPHGHEEEELDNLVGDSRAMSASLVGLADVMRHLETTQKIIATLRSAETQEWLKNIVTECTGVVKESNTEILKATFVLNSQIESQMGYISYLEERARNQVNVVSPLHVPCEVFLLTLKLFNLITRSDVQASIELARATKNDSSSMKTIAIMTMAFLPATFFAALFAMPMLEWKSTPVIQERFWMYWAFTLPCTALVFLLWFLITNWEQIFKRIWKRPPSGQSTRLSHGTASEKDDRNVSLY